MMNQGAVDAVTVNSEVCSMWLELARSFRGTAVANADIVEELDDAGRMRTINAARFAEACFWQSTGDDDTINLRDILPTIPDQSPQGGD
jgi:hypothetical protein